MVFHHRILKSFWSRIALAGLFAVTVIPFSAVSIGAQTPGDTDPTFGAGQVGATGPGAAARAVVVQTDGRILVAGEFTEVGGALRGRVARLNADGTLDATFGAGQTGANGRIETVAVQPDGKILVGGDFTRVNGAARGNLARLNPDGSLDAAFGAGQAGANVEIMTIQLQGDGKILIGGGFTQVNGTTRGGIARLNADGTLDETFGDGLAGTNGTVDDIAVQPDGKILIGGNFGTVNGTERTRLARLNTDGTLEATFSPTFGGGIDLANARVEAIVLQPDGRVILGGAFTRINGTNRSDIARLNADGTLDPTFGDGLAGTNGAVFDLFLQPDGRIVIGGGFSEVNGVAREDVARLNADGTLDPTFAVVTFGVSVQLAAVARQTDGRVVLGGNFTQVNGVARSGIDRLNDNGTSDGAFVPTTFLAPDGVRDIAIQPDGKILASGDFRQFNGATRGRIARLNADGALDTTFGDGLVGADNTVSDIALQPDGKILIGGNFTQVNGVARGRIARLNPDGSLDTTFGDGLTGADSPVGDIAVQPDGKILIGGVFGQVNGVARGRIARLNADGTLDATFGDGLAGPNLAVSVVNLRPDGKILIGGVFTQVNGVTRGQIARLNADGTLDATFGDGLAGAQGGVFDIAVLPDGRMLVAGGFVGFNGNASIRLIVRLNPDGTTDATFAQGQIAVNSVRSVALQRDGRIVIGGRFAVVGGQARNSLARLNPDGTLDTAFGNGLSGLADGGDVVIALQDDGRILVGERFSEINGVYRGSVARLFAGCPTITVEPTTPTLPAATVGAPYSQTFTQTGGNGTVTFTRPGGTLPDGLTFSNGVLSGTPTESGAFSFTVVATDVNGCFGSREYTLAVNPAVCPTISVGPEGSILPNGQVNGSYSQTFTQTGGAAPASFAVTAGALPAGLTLAGDGTLTGAPTVTGTFNFTVTATDANGCFGSRAYSLSVNCQTISVAPTLATLPGGTLGVAYSQTFTQTGGVGTTVFSFSGGTLPPGLAFTAATVTLAGIPTESGTYLFSILATDANGCTGSRVYSLSVNCPILVLNPTNTTLPGGTVGTPYSGLLSVTGGSGSYDLSIVGGALPMGISLTGGGSLSGNPTEAGNFGFTVQARDTATNCVTTRAYFITISPAATGTPVLVNGQVNLTITGQSLETATCPGYANDLVLTGTLTNTGQTTITDPYFEVLELREATSPAPGLPFRLLTATGAGCGAGGLVGSQQPVGGAGFVLNPGQSVSVTFRIALPAVRRFRFFLNVFGTLPSLEQRQGSPAKLAKAVPPPLRLEIDSPESRQRRDQ